MRPDLSGLLSGWLTALDTELPAAIRLRHDLHADPELSGAELRTPERVRSAIGGDAAATATVVAGTGRLLRVGPDGPAVAIRAELDALPLSEDTGAPYASTTGAMHACGHDVHLAALTALARAARQVRLPLGLVVLLQPREEVGPTGAQDVLASGALDRHDVRTLIGAHVQPLLPAGSVTADAGPVNAAVDEIEITVTGRGGHGAYPQLAIDPVPALCRAVLALQDAVRSAVDPMQPAVVSMTQLSAADAPNVIPDVARAVGTVRTMRPEVAAALQDRILVAVQGVAAAHGCTGTVTVRRGEPALVNDPAVAAAARRWLDRLGISTASFASCGSDDFATYGTTLPIAMLFVGTGAGTGTGTEAGGGAMLHDPRYLPGDEMVRAVARAQLAGWLAAAETVLADASQRMDGDLLPSGTRHRAEPEGHAR